jgi:hypothetical protein
VANKIEKNKEHEYEYKKVVRAFVIVIKNMSSVGRFKSRKTIIYNKLAGGCAPLRLNEENRQTFKISC